jgi:hypothetical protein
MRSLFDSVPGGEWALVWSNLGKPPQFFHLSCRYKCNAEPCLVSSIDAVHHISLERMLVEHPYWSVVRGGVLVVLVVNEYLWTQKKTNNSIEIRVTVDLYHVQLCNFAGLIQRLNKISRTHQSASSTKHPNAYIYFWFTNSLPSNQGL